MRDLPIRVAIMAAALFVATIGILATTVFLCVALYLFLATAMSPTLAALATAGTALVLSLLAILIGSMINTSIARRARREREAKGGLTNAIKAEVGQVLGDKVVGAILERPYISLALALGIGVVVGISPRLRNIIKNAL